MKAGIRRDGRLALRWETDTSPSAEQDVWVRWSGDRGRTWRAVTVGLRGSSAILDISHVPGGRLTFQVMLHDGFSTAVARTRALTVPTRPPTVAIMWPADGATLEPSRAVRLWGAVNGVDGSPIADPDARWSIGRKTVASGLFATIDPLPEGKHRIALRSHGVRTVHAIQVRRAATRSAAPPGTIAGG